MVIGSGLLSRTFSHFKQDKKVTIFASGVSNSGETRADEFEREIDLLEKHLHAEPKLIYFSTISVHDPAIQNSPYIRHKRNAEKLITEHADKYMVFRLPILVGRTSNPNTLANFLFSKISSNETIHLFKNAGRYLMDADDAGELLTGIIRSGDFDNAVLDINFDNLLSIESIIGIYEKVLGKNAVIKLTDKGGSYSTDNKIFLDYLKRIGFERNDDYETVLIKKYFG